MTTRLVSQLNPQPFPVARRSRKVLKTIRPGPGQSIWGHCIGQEIFGHETHWWDEGAGKRLCLPPCERCELWRKTGDRQHAPRWYGFIDVLWPATGWVVVFEITRDAHDECALLKDKRVPLRGKVIRLTRMGKGKFGRVKCTIEPATFETCLPRGEDLQAWARMAFEVDPFQDEPFTDGKTKGAGE